MSFNKKKLAAYLGLAMGMSVIASNSNAIEVAADGAGKLLMGPMYTANAGDTTRITITNPDNDRAVKARLAFRSKEYSKEFLDFIVYLSPGDVFRGDIYGAEDGTVMFRTSDDSVRHLPGNPNEVVFSNDVATDFAVPLGNITDEGDTVTSGHIEVLAVYSAEGTIAVPNGNIITITRGMSKTDLAQVFDADLGSELLALNGCVTADETCELKQTVPGIAKIYGQLEVVVAGSNRAYYPFTALRDSDEDNDGTIECFTTAANRYCEKVNGNGQFDVVVGNALEVGVALNANGDDNIVNIERAIATAAAEGNYETDNDTSTSIMVTFPTKYRHRLVDVCVNPGFTTPLPAGLEYSSPFRADRAVEYYVSQFNNSEGLVPGCVPVTTTDTNLISGDLDNSSTTTCPPAYILPEVEVIPYDWTTQMDGTTAVPEGYESGKYEIAINAAPNNTCANLYSGVPAIVKTLKQQSSTGQIIGVEGTH